MTSSDLITKLLERGNAMQQFWGFYITVSLGLVAFFGSGKRSPKLASILSIGFIAFAYVNCDGMTDVARQREFLYSRLPAADIVDRQAITVNSTGWADASTNTARTALRRLSNGGVLRGFGLVSQPPPAADVRNFHVGIDMGVLMAIWFLTLRSKPDDKEKARIRNAAMERLRHICKKRTLDRRSNVDQPRSPA